MPAKTKASDTKNKKKKPLRAERSMFGERVTCWRCFMPTTCNAAELLSPHDQPDGQPCPCSKTPFPRCKEFSMAPAPFTTEPPPKGEVSGELMMGWIAENKIDKQTVDAFPAYVTITGTIPQCDCPRHSPEKYGIPLATESDEIWSITAAPPAA